MFGQVTSPSFMICEGWSTSHSSIMLPNSLNNCRASKSHPSGLGSIQSDLGHQPNTCGSMEPEDSKHLSFAQRPSHGLKALLSTSQLCEAGAREGLLPFCLRRATPRAMPQARDGARASWLQSRACVTCWEDEEWWWVLWTLKFFLD